MKNLKVSGTSKLYYKFWVKSNNTLHLNLKDASLKRVLIENCSGVNTVAIAGEVRNSTIIIDGYSNELIIEESVALNHSTIVVRGNHCRVHIKQFTTIGGTHFICMGQGKSLMVGENCMLAEQSEIWASDSHPIFSTHNKTKPMNESRDVVIGNHVWVGKKAIVLKGVEIGNNAIIGMASVVTKNVPANTIVAGNPAKVIKNEVDWSREFITI